MGLKDLTSDLSKYRPADAYLKATTRKKRALAVDQTSYSPKDMQIPVQQNAKPTEGSIHLTDNSNLNIDKGTSFDSTSKQKIPVNQIVNTTFGESNLRVPETNIVKFNPPSDKVNQAAVISKTANTQEKVSIEINTEQKTHDLTKSVPVLDTVVAVIKKKSPVTIGISSELSGRHTVGVEVKPLPGTPKKSGVDTKPLIPTPEKMGVDTKPLIGTPEKMGIDPKPLIGPLEKVSPEIDDSKYTFTLGVYGGYTSPLKANISQYDPKKGNISRYESTYGNIVKIKSPHSLADIDPTKYTIKNTSIFYPTQFADSSLDNISTTPYTPAGYNSLNSLYDYDEGSVPSYTVTLENSAYPDTTAMYSVDVNTIGSQLAHSVNTALIKSTGYTGTATYGQAAGIGGLLGPRYIVRNSPSLLDNLYSKNPLTLAAWNPTYALQPFIVRNIGQQWGSPNAGYDGGFIRGGAQTAANRAVADALRITRWMASPNGLLWVVRQQGLQLTNPKVETADPTGFYRSTRLFNPLSMLKNTLGRPAGVHLTRHGLIPPEVSLNRYEEVVKTRSGLVGVSQSSFANRLVKLYNEMEPINEIADALQPKNKIRSKLGGFFQAAALKLASVFRSDRLPWITLSGVAGPKSLYGIGATIHSRWTNSFPQDAGSYSTYNVRSQYASTFALTTNPFGSSMDDRATYNIDELDATGLRKTLKKASVSEAPGNPYHPEFNNLGQNPGSVKSSELNESPYFPPIKDYVTLKYNQLGRTGEGDLIAERFSSFQDFRNALPHGKYSGQSSKAGTTLGKAGTLEYSEVEPIKKFGMIDTSPGLDKTDYTKKQNRGDKINSIDYGQYNYNDIYIVDGIEYRDYIQFFFSGPNLRKLNDKTEDVIPFRAILGSVSDSHNPQWNSQELLGRADPAYLYQGYTRALNFTFKVAANSREEMKPMWRKINYLASWTTPKYLGKIGMKAPFCRLTLGNLFQETPGFISSLNIDIGNEVPWEINLENEKDMMQLPMSAEITVGFTPVHDFRPQWGGRMFSLSPRGRNGNENPEGENWLYDSLRK